MPRVSIDEVARQHVQQRVRNAGHSANSPSGIGGWIRVDHWTKQNSPSLPTKSGSTGSATRTGSSFAGRRNWIVTGAGSAPQSRRKERPFRNASAYPSTRHAKALTGSAMANTAACAVLTDERKGTRGFMTSTRWQKHRRNKEQTSARVFFPCSY